MPGPVPMPPLGPMPSLGPSGLGKLPEEMPPLDAKTLAATRSALQQETEGLSQNLTRTGYNPMGGRNPLNGRLPVTGMGETPTAPGTSGLSVPGMGGTPGGGRTTGGSTLAGGRQRIAGAQVETEEGAIPRGTVVGGGVAGGQGRGGLLPTSTAIGEQTRNARGRRRAEDEEEPEGVVGGTPTREDRRTRRNARNFTSGGAGLGGERDESAEDLGEETPHAWE
jgi:hypothetical protein